MNDSVFIEKQRQTSFQIHNIRLTNTVHREEQPNNCDRHIWLSTSMQNYHFRFYELTTAMFSFFSFHESHFATGRFTLDTQQ